MAEKRVLRGIELRYVLTHNLDVHGAASIYDMLELLESQGFAAAGSADCAAVSTHPAPCPAPPRPAASTA